MYQRGFTLEAMCLLAPTAPENFHLFTERMCEHPVDSTLHILLPG